PGLRPNHSQLLVSHRSVGSHDVWKLILALLRDQKLHESKCQIAHAPLEELRNNGLFLIARDHRTQKQGLELRCTLQTFPNQLDVRIDRLEVRLAACLFVESSGVSARDLHGLIL